MRNAVVGLVVAGIAGMALAADDFGTLTVRVEGINDRPGEVGVALFQNPKGYPTHLEHAYQVEWLPLQAGQATAEVVFEGVPFGEYALSVMHDENGNRTLEQSTLGFPEEGVGFSNGQRVQFSAPKFSNAKFAFTQPQQLVIPLDYRD